MLEEPRNMLEFVYDKTLDWEIDEVLDDYDFD